MRFHSVFAAFSVFGLVGCSEPLDRTGSPGWARAKATPAEFQKDSDECERHAMLIPARSSSVAGVVAQRRERFDNCMVDRGWRWEPNVSKDRSLDTVDCKLPSVEQVQRVTMRECRNRLGKVL